MANLAAIIPAPKAPLEVQEVEIYRPGPHEILIKNEVVAFNQIEAKIAKLGSIPIEYPAILGSVLAGTVEAIGPEATGFQTGEKVVSLKKFEDVGNQYGAYQRYVVVKDVMVSKVPADIAAAGPASLMMNLACLVGLFSGRLGLDRPNLDGSTAPFNGQKILIYGGSSSFGGLSVQYLIQAGYTVITTSSPKNRDFVAKLGAATVIDHTLQPDALVQALLAEGRYDLGGGKLYAMQPAFGPETLPDGVERVFEPWSDPLYEEKNRGLLEWLLNTYMPQGISQGAVAPLPIEKIDGGLKGVNGALDKLLKGVGAVRLVVDPWE